MPSDECSGSIPKLRAGRNLNGLILILSHPPPNNLNTSRKEPQAQLTSNMKPMFQNDTIFIALFRYITFEHNVGQGQVRNIKIVDLKDYHTPPPPSGKREWLGHVLKCNSYKNSSFFLTTNTTFETKRVIWTFQHEREIALLLI